MMLAPDYTYTPEPAPTGKDAVVLYTAISWVSSFCDGTEWLAAALVKRADMGIEKYGDYLRINNGRRAMVDYLQEQLDAIMYAMQVCMESPSFEAQELLRLATHAAIFARDLIERGL